LLGRIVLAEAALETIPRELWSHPSIYRYSRKRGKPPYRLLLDAAQHHQAMRRLPGREYRGRPDIVHATLLALLESPLCTKGGCEAVVATVGGHVIRVRPGTRLPRNYLRFTGLMEQLLSEGRVPPGPGEPLLWLEQGGLREVLQRYRPLALLPGAERAAGLEEVVEADTILVPATPRSEPTPRLLAALEEAGLEAFRLRGLEGAEPWVIVSRLLCAAEQAAGLL